MRVLGPNVLIQQFVSRTKSKGGIVLPGSEDKLVPYGRVIECGEYEPTDETPAIPVGVCVYFSPLGGQYVETPKGLLCCVNVEDVLIVFDDDAECPYGDDADA